MATSAVAGTNTGEESELKDFGATGKLQEAGQTTNSEFTSNGLHHGGPVRGDDSSSDGEIDDGGHDDEGGKADELSDLPQQPISKNQLKKLKRQRIWEERKEDRKRRRKEKRHDRQARKRDEKNQKIAEIEAAGLNPTEVLQAEKQARQKRTPVPVTIILDCDFEQYMLEQELISLSSQIVRSYSMNRQGAYQAHLFISSWKGKLKTRHETVLQNHHHKWQGVHFLEDDFVEAGKQAHDFMKGSKGGLLEGAIAPAAAPDKAAVEGETNEAPHQEPTPIPDKPSIVYLTADSPYTLGRLEPYTSYVIGGIVDRNREKNLCYKRAEERGIKTAKLPIGEYIKMQSRQVLTTNHVVEIMSKWLECGDWGEAFLAVIPKRKGGKLKDEADETESQPGEAEEASNQAGDESKEEEHNQQEDVIPNVAENSGETSVKIEVEQS